MKRAIQTQNRGDLIHAMHENRTLWNALAVDVASSENELPEDLRARIFYLAEFVTHHTRRVLQEKATAVALLEVNVAILGGLKNEGTPT